MAVATTRQVLQAWLSSVNDKLTAAGLDTITLVRLGRVVQLGLGRLAEQQYSTPQAGRFERTNADGSRNYVTRVGGGRSVELHCWPTGTGPAGAVLWVYSGAVDATADGPLDGLVPYYREVVDPTLVADDAAARTWLATRITTGLPSAP